MKISVVIPAYNEAKRIPDTLHEISQHIKEDTLNTYELIVVNDGSSDNTSDTVNSLGEKIPQITLLHHSLNQGKGAALRTGVMHSTGGVVLTVDADGSTPFGELPKLMSALQDSNGDISIGSRHHADAEIVVKQPWYRIMISRLANVIIQWTILPGISDTQCGFKLFKGDIARELFSRATIKGFGHDMEILVMAKKAGYKIIEVPVTWLDSKDSTLRPIRSTLKTFLELIKIIYRHYIKG